MEAADTRSTRWRDDLWQRFKKKHGFDPKDFERAPPWCVEGAANNPWAERVFLGDARRENAWSFLGYTDAPFSFAYVWLDAAAFSGILLKSSRLPLVVEKSSGELRREARRLAKDCQNLSRLIGSWAFRDVLVLEQLLKDSDFRLSETVRVFGAAAQLDPDRRHAAIQAMRAGIRFVVPFALGGKGSILDRAAAALGSWEPPPSPVDRPRREGLKQRYAVRWLSDSLNQLGGAIPPRARVLLITELLNALAERGEWTEEAWGEERVRRCLDGISKSRKRDSV